MAPLKRLIGGKDNPMRLERPEVSSRFSIQSVYPNRGRLLGSDHFITVTGHSCREAPDCPPVPDIQLDNRRGDGKGRLLTRR
jgi:hypothetical protein